MPVTIIGLDCATDPRRFGLALGTATRRGGVRILKCGTASEQDPGEGADSEGRTTGASSDPADLAPSVRPVVRVIRRWLDSQRSLPVLLAIDAPLGWPRAMGSLAGHRAGAPLPQGPTEMFRRATDRFVHARMGRLPLEVGADRIARTALVALQILERLGPPGVPLAWTPASVWGRSLPCSAIEVYPAAVLLARGLPPSGYKGTGDAPVRRELLESVLPEFGGTAGCAPERRSRMLEEADVFDAGLCLLAGLDFLRGRAALPEDLERAAVEGWIWVVPRRG